MWIPNASRLAEGSLAVSSSLYPDEKLVRTEFYADWLRRLDLFHGLGSAIVKQGTRDVKLTLVRSRRAGAYTAGELGAIRQLLPHLRSAVTLHHTLQHALSLSASAVAALELVPLGVALLDRSGGLLHANRHAHRLAAATGALRLAAGSIEAATPSATSLLKGLVDGALRTAAGGHSPAGRRPRPAQRDGRATGGGIVAFRRVGPRGAVLQ